MKLIIALLLLAQVSFAQSTIGINNTYEFTASIVYFKTPEYVYFSVNDTVFRLQTSQVTKLSSEVKELPYTTLQHDMYMFTKKGKQSMGLYITGGVLGLIGGGFIVGGYPIAGAVIALGGNVFTLSGFITEVSAWKIGYRMGLKQYAIDYKR